MPYQITHCYKSVSDYGADGAGMNTRDHGDILRTPIVCATLAGAIDKALACFGLPSTFLFMPDYGDGSVDRFTVNRIEDRNGDEPSTHEEAECAAGRLTLYLCDYDFSVACIETRPINVTEIAELKAARPGMTIEN